MLIERLSDYLYLLMLMNLCNMDWDSQLEKIDISGNDENMRAILLGKVKIRQVWKFPKQ